MTEAVNGCGFGFSLGVLVVSVETIMQDGQTSVYTTFSLRVLYATWSDPPPLKWSALRYGS
jgi:hypothetical protein